MTDELIPTSEEVKITQYRNAMIIGMIAAILIGVIWYMMRGDSPDELTKQKKEAAAFTSPVDQVNTQSVWVERIQNRVRDQEKKSVELTNEIVQLKNNNSQKSIESDPHFQALQKQNQILQETLKASESTHDQPLSGSHAYSGQVFSTVPGAAQSNANTVKPSEAAGIDNDEIILKTADNLPKKNPDSFVPAGTFVEAIMLGAADASAGVQAQANPSPMLFRVVANGTLPNHQKSHLKDCVVTAAVVGDISSERGQIRLERLSCTFPNGEIVEQAVEGTIFGMDAKNGVRGSPVWREGALLGRAAIAGTLSALGGALAQTYTTNSISPLGATSTVDNGDIFKYGASQGVSHAMEKLADYNIRRAEQYHPVIQLSAGQPVDVVFLKGFYLDGRKVEESHEDTRDSSALFPSPSNQVSASGLTLSEQELAKIKRQEQNMGWVDKNQSGGMQ